MSSLVLLLVTGIAGGAGAVARFGLEAEVRRRWPVRFPWGTLVVNVSGSMLLGFLAGLGHEGTVYTVLGTGFCGGYTTFSTAMVETVRLAELRARLLAAAYAVGSLVVSLAAAYLGSRLG